MTFEEIKKTKAETNKTDKALHAGKPFSEQDKKEYEQAWKDMEDCFHLANKKSS